MNLSNFLTLAGGLALFLHGMKMMSEGLEATAGNKLKKLLERLTTNPILGVVVGAGITAVIQSSSATTVMVVGFVNSGLMGLTQAVWVIMGANIGTTITGQLIALDIGAIAPVFAIVGVVMTVFIKNKKVNHLGEIIAGLGILFIGMGVMGDSMVPLRESKVFVDFITNFKNPILGILAGAGFTAVIQSSSAAVGILQTLANQGLIGLSSSVFVLFGQNIGTCITAVLASIGTSRNAKRTTIVHLLFNVIGTVIFIAICLMTPFVDFVISLTPTKPSAQIANAHTIFNIVTCILLLPFGKYLAALATKILPGKDEEAGDMQLAFLDLNMAKKEYGIGQSAIIISQLQKEVGRMFNIAKENVGLSFESVETLSVKAIDQVEKTEDYIDYLNTEISRFISHAIAAEMPQSDAEVINSMFTITGNIERIADHAMNIAGYARMIFDKGYTFSDVAMEEIRSIKAISMEHLELIAKVKEKDAAHMLLLIEKAESQIDDMTLVYRQNQIERLKQGACNTESCVIYSELLTDFERIGDHLLNIAQEYANIENNLALD